ncbi:hypothetical protein LOD99_3210 [Oopsacas minuta]|uniref:C2H2-type domain-containing protein n=1 Tax=Oopsacas minuta TaxID=111878 RepID=A0AAV7JXQ5_9METZ|nr:hypothetical protein LOD99_3210 [Oopsacas minuta]
MSAKRRGKLVPKTKIASNWLSEDEKVPKARKKDTYKCFCNKRYSSAAYLARHILKNHAPSNGVNTEDGAASQEGRLGTSEILGPGSSSEANTKNNECNPKVGEHADWLPSPQVTDMCSSTKAPRKKLRPKGRARPTSSYKYRNRRKTDGKTSTDVTGVTRIKPKVELEESTDLVNCDPLLLNSEIGEEVETSMREVETPLDSFSFPQSVYDFDDVSDDEGIGELPDFKSEEFDDDVSSKEDETKSDIFNDTNMSIDATSGISMTGSTPVKKRSMRTYQGGIMKRLHACHICSKTYSSVGKLKRHMKSHTEEGQKRLFTCGICQKSFNSNSVLIAHIRVHTGEKPFKCDECDMAFKQTSHLNRHKRVHSGEKPFTCEICKKGFPHNFNLVIHRRKHTGEKPYVCNVCNHPFADRSNLNKHMPRCLRRLCEQIDVMGPLDGSMDEYLHDRRKNSSRVKSELTRGDSDDNLFGDTLGFPVTYEQVITQAVEEVPGTSSYMDETPYHTPDEGNSFDMGATEHRDMAHSLIGQIEPSRVMREVDVMFVEGDSNEGGPESRFRRKDTGRRGEVYPDATPSKKRTRSKPNANTPTPKRQSTPRKRSPKKATKQDSDSNLHHSIGSPASLPHNIFQDDSNERMTDGRTGRGNDHTGSDFAILAEQILDDQMTMESESNLTELLIPVDSGWMEHTKGVAKQQDQSHRRPPPVSELFKLTRPPEMDEPSTELTPEPYNTLPTSSTPEISWSGPATSPPNSVSTTAQEQDSITLPTLPSTAQEKPTEYTSMEIEPNNHFSPVNTIGSEVEEVYAQFPDPSYDQGLEVNTKNIIISEPNREY